MQHWATYSSITRYTPQHIQEAANQVNHLVTLSNLHPQNSSHPKSKTSLSHIHKTQCTNSPTRCPKTTSHPKSTTPSHHIASHHITSHHITSHHITSHHITSHHFTSHHITSLHNTSHHFTSQRITTHHNASQCITMHHPQSFVQLLCTRIPSSYSSSCSQQLIVDPASLPRRRNPGDSSSKLFLTLKMNPISHCHKHRSQTLFPTPAFQKLPDTLSKST